MNVLIEIPKSESGEIVDLSNQYPDNIIIIHQKPFEGSEEILKILLDLTETFGPIILDYLLNRKKKNKPTTIIVDGVEIQYDTQEELEVILKTKLNKEDKKENKI